MGIVSKLGLVICILLLVPIVSAQIDSAKGLFYLGKGGKIYTQLPNTRVGEYLLNQVAGKAKESVEVISSDEQPWIINLNK